jgi:hypothetical protein
MPQDNGDLGWRELSVAARGLSHPCPDHGRMDAADPQQWISVHRTSTGMVVYYRCRCGRICVASDGDNDGLKTGRTLRDR